MRVFFDSSAFAKRYISEPGTDKVLAWCDQATEIGLSAIALPEIISAFCRLRREGKVDDTQYRQMIKLTSGRYRGCRDMRPDPNGAGTVDHQSGSQRATRHGRHPYQ